VLPADGASEVPTEQPNHVLQRFCHAVIVRDGSLTDGQLLECFVKSHDEAAFEVLVRRHGSMVLGACRRVLGNLQDAEDAFQATFLVLVRKAASINQRELLGNWLYGVAYRTALEARAAIVKRRVRERQVDTMPEPVIGIATETWHDLQPIFDRELSCLPDKYRMAIVFCDLEGRTRREVARQLGIPVGTLSGRLTVAREMLAKRLSCRGLALSAGALTSALFQGAASARVSSRLVASTVEVTMAAAAKQSMAMASGQLAMMDGGMNSMSLKMFSIATAIFLAVGLLVGMGSPSPLAVGSSSRPQKESKGIDEPKQAAVANMKPRVFDLDSRGRRVVWSPDGKTLAVVTKNESLLNRNGSAIKLWNVEKGQVRDTLVKDSGKGLAFQHVAFSPDGKIIAAAVSEEVVLPNLRLIRSVVKSWDAKTLNLTQILGDNESDAVHIAFSPDSKVMAFCDPRNTTVNLWNVATGKIEHVLDTKGTQPWHTAFSPDNKTLVVGGQKGDKSGVVTLWDVETGKLKVKIELEKYISEVDFSPDGKMIASSEGGPEAELTRIWNAEQGKLLISLKGSKQGSRTVAFLSNKILAVGGRDGKVRIWDVQTGMLSETLEGHTGEIYSIAVSPDGKSLASVSQDETLRLWPISKWTGGAK
jgi:RNA polymerase sigma factor (sigma-70 family)